MTVKELQEKLAKMPPDVRVFAMDGDDCIWQIANVDETDRMGDYPSAAVNFVLSHEEEDAPAVIIRCEQ